MSEINARDKHTIEFKLKEPRPASFMMAAFASGWNTIGSTEQPFFDAQRDPPALLAPGDMIRFRAERIIK